MHRARLPGRGPLKISQNIHQHKLLGRAQHGAHPRNLGNLLRLELRIAAHDGHKRLGVVLKGLLHHLPALAVGVVGHGAGINNVQVGPGLKGDFGKALVLKLPADGRRFGEVQLAAEGVKSNGLGGRHTAAKIRQWLMLPIRHTG